jgi:uncharacterized repeat protein (TIGR03803 family)
MPIPVVSPRFAASLFKTCAVVCLSCLLFAPTASATTVRILFSPKPSQGAHLWGNLVFDSIGNLYGTAQQGGGKCIAFRKGCGSVFQLAPRLDGTWAPTILHHFIGGTDGYLIYAGVILDSAGNLYGTAAAGGTENYGIAYELSPGPNGWTETVLHSFPSQTGDGEYPSPLVFDQNGNLYGVSYVGLTPCNQGTVFQLSPNGKGQWMENQLACFPGGGTAPGYLNAPVIFDPAGNIYSTTYLGGLNGSGTVYELSPSGSGWTETVIHNFDRDQLVDSWPPLVRDKNGNLFGVIYGGIFELMPSGEGWSYSTIYTSGTDPHAIVPNSLIMDAAGNLYGTAQGGASSNCKHASGCGAIFKLTQGKNGWLLTDLYDFPGGAGGESPYGGLVMDQDGNLYGATYNGGRKGCGGGCGVVYEITP